MKFPKKPKLNLLLTSLFFLLTLAILSQPLPHPDLTPSHILGDSSINWSHSQGSAHTRQKVTVTATIDGYLLNMVGWTSPHATVHLTATQTDAKHDTLADSDGQFIFSSLLLPKETGLFCFLSEDTDSIASIPYCLTPPPSLSALFSPHSSVLTSLPPSLDILGDSSTFKVSTDSGIVLAPSVSLNETKLKQYTDLDTTGRTVPNSLVNIYLSKKKENLFQKLFPRIFSQVKANDQNTNLYHSTFSDPEGNFVFDLPTDSDLTYEFTTNSATNHGLSAESNPLRYQLYTPLQWIFFIINSILFSLLKWLLNLLTTPLVIIFIQLLILALLLKKFFLTPPKAHPLPALYQKTLVPLSHYQTSFLKTKKYLSFFPLPH